MLCLKFDMATRLGRNFLGLNVQHGDENGVHTTTLAVREIKSAVTGGELAKLITTILRDEFDISMSQIYSITTDNGSNALAAGRFINADLVEELDNFAEEDDQNQAEELLQSSANDLQTSTSDIHLVRCAAHTLALAVNDCIGRKASSSIKALLQEARSVVCTLRTSNLRKELKRQNLPMAIPDVETRWGSTYDMLHRLLQLSTFCKNNEMLNDKLKLPAETWRKLQELVETLAPVRQLTTKLQDSSLTPGEAIGNWQLIMAALEQIGNPIAEILLRRMDIRGKSLITSPVLAAIYLDPKYQVLLSENQRNAAKAELKFLYKRLLRLKHQQDNSSSTVEDEASATSNSDLNQMSPMQLLLLSKEKERNFNQACASQQITSLINSFDLKNYTEVDCVFRYWAEHDSKTLSNLAWTVLALPMTQVSVERLFSGVKYILSDLRNSLAEDTLQAIMLQRTNI